MTLDYGDKANNDLDALLNEAMESEKKAESFYDEASSKAKSQAGKKFFKELAIFESKHYYKIKKIIESRNNKIKFETSYKSKKLPKINAEIEGEIETNKDEIVNVINLAIEAEKNAQERYRKIADLFDDEEAKKIFNNLSEDERNHQRMLEDQFYHISNKGTIIWD
jgi:rubrerythrin